MYLLSIVVIFSILYFFIHKSGKPSSSSEKISAQPDQACAVSDEKDASHRHYDIRSFLIFSSIFWGIGLVMVIGGCIKLREYNLVKKTYLSTNALITDVREYEVRDSEGNVEDKRDVSLTYTVDDQEYHTVIKKANIFQSVGYEIPIYYAPDNPENIVSPDHVEFKLSFIIPMGIILCIIPFVLEISGRIMLRKNAAEHHRSNV